jgi:hypothetical protein
LRDVIPKAHHAVEFGAVDGFGMSGVVPCQYGRTMSPGRVVIPTIHCWMNLFNDCPVNGAASDDDGTRPPPVLESFATVLFIGRCYCRRIVQTCNDRRLVGSNWLRIRLGALSNAGSTNIDCALGASLMDDSASSSALNARPPSRPLHLRIARIIECERLVSAYGAFASGYNCGNLVAVTLRHAFSSSHLKFLDKRWAPSKGRGAITRGHALAQGAIKTPAKAQDQKTIA